MRGWRDLTRVFHEGSLLGSTEWQQCRVGLALVLGDGFYGYPNTVAVVPFSGSRFALGRGGSARGRRRGRGVAVAVRLLPGPLGDFRRARKTRGRLRRGSVYDGEEGPGRWVGGLMARGSVYGRSGGGLFR